MLIAVEIKYEALLTGWFYCDIQVFVRHQRKYIANVEKIMFYSRKIALSNSVIVLYRSVVISMEIK